MEPGADLVDFVGAQRELLQRRQFVAAGESEQLQEAVRRAVEDRRARRVGAALLLHEAALLQRSSAYSDETPRTSASRPA